MPTIIHVDDDQSVLDLNEHVLADVPDHVQVVGAANAQEALDALRRAPDPVLLIMDHWMPDMTGVQLWSECKDRHPDRDLDAIVLTGSLDDQLEAELKQMGVQMIWKPMDLNSYTQRVMEGVTGWLERGGAGRQRAPDSVA